MVVLEYSTVGVLRLSDIEHISFPFLIFFFPWAFAYVFLLVPVGRSIGLRLLLAAHTHHGSVTGIITWLDIHALWNSLPVACLLCPPQWADIIQTHSDLAK